MVAATDIITYVGVPLAVLGVMPIMYNFLSAMYARYRVRRILRRDTPLPLASIRTRLMSGLVDVDLPVFQLTPHAPSDPRYWDLNPSPIKSASWRLFNWEQNCLSFTTIRMQSSDKIVLPEAVANFSQLVDFLLDRGARFSPPGIHSLSGLGAQIPAGTILMAMGSDNVMTVASPGIHYPALSVELHWTSDLQSTGRNGDSLPARSIEVEQLRKEGDTLIQPMIIEMGEKKIEGFKTKSGNDESWRERRIGATLIDKLNQNGIEHNVWLASALVAVFGGATYKFKYDHGILFFCQRCLVPLQSLLFIMPERERGNWEESRLKLINDYCDKQNAIFPQAWGEISPSLQDRAESLSREPYEIATSNVLLAKIIAYQQNKKTYNLWVDMPMLLHCCFILLEQNTHQILDRICPAQDDGQSMVLQSAPEAITAAGERILRIMVFDESFSKQVIGTLKEAYTLFLSKAGTDEAERLPWTSNSERPPLVIVAALIILVNIGLQASYFVAGEEMAKCTTAWQTVYVS